VRGEGRKREGGEEREKNEEKDVPVTATSSVGQQPAVQNFAVCWPCSRTTLSSPRMTGFIHQIYFGGCWRTQLGINVPSFLVSTMVQSPKLKSTERGGCE
jgi:hypothetical protein